MSDSEALQSVLDRIVTYAIPIGSAILSVFGCFKSLTNSKKAKEESERARKYASEANEYYKSGKRYYEEVQSILEVNLIRDIEEMILIRTNPMSLPEDGLVTTTELYEYLSLYDKKHVDKALASLVKKSRFDIINMENDEPIKEYDSSRHTLLIRNFKT